MTFARQRMQVRGGLNATVEVMVNERTPRQQLVPLSHWHWGVETQARGQTSVAYAKRVLRRGNVGHPSLSSSIVPLPTIHSLRPCTISDIRGRSRSNSIHDVYAEKQDGRTYNTLVRCTTTPIPTARSRFPQHHRTNIARDAG